MNLSKSKSKWVNDSAIKLNQNFDWNHKRQRSNDLIGTNDFKTETKAYNDSFKTRIEIKTNDSKTTQNESDFDFTFVTFTTNSLVCSQISILLDII